MRDSARVTIVPLDSNLFDRGLRLMASRPDKNWSLTDCISFVVMKERSLSDALTADRHFEQAGFRALMLA
nr:nucleic acid-binding protein [Blastocatellia bacterium]